MISVDDLIKIINDLDSANIDLELLNNICLFYFLYNKQSKKYPNFEQTLNKSKQILSLYFYLITNEKILKDIKQMKKTNLSLVYYLNSLISFAKDLKLSIEILDLFLLDFKCIELFISNKKVKKWWPIAKKYLFECKDSIYLIMNKNKYFDFFNFINDDEINNFLQKYIESFSLVDFLLIDELYNHKNKKSLFVINNQNKQQIRKKRKEIIDIFFNKTKRWNFEIDIFIGDVKNSMFELNFQNQRYEIKIDKNIFKIPSNDTDALSMFFGFVPFDINSPIRSLKYSFNPFINENCNLDAFLNASKDKKYGNLNYDLIFSIISMINLIIFELLNKSSYNFENLFLYLFDNLINKYIVNNQFFKLNLPKYNLGYQFSCQNIFIQMDSLLKQYHLYKECGKIEKESLFNFEDTLKIENCEALFERKYIEINEQNKIIKRVVNLLFNAKEKSYNINFSKLSELLSLIKKGHNNKNFNFIKFMNEEYIEISPNKKWLNSLNVSDLNFLIQEEIIDQNQKFVNVLKIWILSLLNDNLYFFTFLFDNFFQNIFDDFVEKGWCFYSDKLFSKHEINYLNFINTNAFTNSLGLRNKYIHGLMNFHNEDEHKNNYLISFRNLLIIVFKIENELVFKLNEFSSFDFWVSMFDYENSKNTRKESDSRKENKTFGYKF